MYVIYLNWSDIVYGWLRKIVIPVFMAVNFNSLRMLISKGYL